MSDTVVFGKVIRGSFIAGSVYVLMDIFISGLMAFAQALFELDPVEWSSWWTPKKVAWGMLQFCSMVSSALITFKAFNSKSR